MAPQKRTAQEADSLLEDVRAVIVDIEGTTTPISFVKDTLFKYFTDNLDAYLEKKYDDAETQKDITALRSLAKKDKEESVADAVEIAGEEASKEDIIKSVAENVRWQMSKDRKSTELKQFQGHVWEQGYKSGEIKGDVYDDAISVLQQLAEEGVKIYVYSSGSIESQKLLFGHTEDGDLNDLFTGYFDTTTGSKTEKSSYEKIIQEIGCKGEEILFLTDCPKEGKAAVDAGMRATLVKRPGNPNLDSEHLQNFNCIETFTELYGDEDFEEDFKRFEGQNAGEDDDEDPDDDEDDDEVDEENPDDDDDA